MPEETAMRNAPTSPIAHRTDHGNVSAPKLRGDIPTGVQKTYRANVGLKLKGDREFDGNLVVEADAIFEGNLTVEGNLMIKKGGSLVVKGNVTARGCISAGDILMKGESLISSGRIDAHTVAIKDVRVEAKEGTAVEISVVGSATVSGIGRVAQQTWDGAEAPSACDNLVVQGSIRAERITAESIFASLAGVAVIIQNGKKQVMIA